VGEAGVVLDLSVGEVRVGRATLRGVADASALEPGAVRLPDGTVLAPLGFGPRSTACAVHGDARRLGAAVLALSRRTGVGGLAGGVHDGEPEGEDGPEGTAIVEALALHLAGARLAGGGPSFGDAAATMSRVFGWGADRVVDCCAHVVDHLAASVLDGGDGEAPGDDGGGWRSFVLVAAADGAEPGGEGPAGVRDRLAADLLRRAAGGLDRRLLPVEEPTAWIGGDHGATVPAGDRGGRGPAAAGPHGGGAGPDVPLWGLGRSSGPRQGVAAAATTWAATAGAPYRWADAVRPTPRSWAAAAESPADAGGQQVDPRLPAPPLGPGPAHGTARPHGAPEPWHPPAPARATEVLRQPPRAGALRAGSSAVGGEPVWPSAGPGADVAWRGAAGPSPAPSTAGIGSAGWPDGPAASIPSIASIASVADLLAAELDDESDLRGVLRW
jgi:hypothetical protein